MAGMQKLQARYLSVVVIDAYQLRNDRIYVTQR